ncbi:MAG: cation-transporting P-type ATPase, partial [Curvibacter sp.]
MNDTVSEPQGLSSAEAARRLAADGPNLLPQGEIRSWQRIVHETVRDPMFLLLLAAALIYLLLGDLQEGLSLLLMVCVVIGLTLYQEGRT